MRIEAYMLALCGAGDRPIPELAGRRSGTYGPRSGWGLRDVLESVTVADVSCDTLPDCGRRMLSRPGARVAREAGGTHAGDRRRPE